MAKTQRKGLEKELLYFFMNGNLHKLIKVYKRDNIAKCFNYDTEEFVSYQWSDIQKNATKSYSMGKVCKLLRINKTTVWKYEKQGFIRPPKRSWPIGSDANIQLGGPAVVRRFSEEEILSLYDALVEVNNGRAHRNFPERPEVESALKNTRILYYKDETGTYKPLWRSAD